MATMKKLKNENILFKEALLAGIKYAELTQQARNYYMSIDS